MPRRKVANYNSTGGGLVGIQQRGAVISPRAVGLALDALGADGMLPAIAGAAVYV